MSQFRFDDQSVDDAEQRKREILAKSGKLLGSTSSSSSPSLSSSWTSKMRRTASKWKMRNGKNS